VVLGPVDLVAGPVDLAPAVQALGVTTDLVLVLGAVLVLAAVAVPVLVLGAAQVQALALERVPVQEQAPRGVAPAVQVLVALAPVVAVAVADQALAAAPEVALGLAVGAVLEVVQDRGAVAVRDRDQVLDLVAEVVAVLAAVALVPLPGTVRHGVAYPPQIGVTILMGLRSFAGVNLQHHCHQGHSLDR
jgi:hypothetical protein